MNPSMVESWDKLKIELEPKTLASRIAFGRFRWVNRHINRQNFPVDFEGEGEQEVHLAVFDREMDDRDGLIELRSFDFRPATLPEFLAVAALLPDVWNFPVIGLGNPFRHSQHSATHYPILKKIRMSRCLDLISSVHPWPKNTRYPAVRIVATP